MLPARVHLSPLVEWNRVYRGSKVYYTGGSKPLTFSRFTVKFYPNQIPYLLLEFEEGVLELARLADLVITKETGKELLLTFAAMTVKNLDWKEFRICCK